MAKQTYRKIYLRPASVVLILSAEEHFLNASPSGSTENLNFYNEYDAGGEQLSGKKDYFWSNSNDIWNNPDE